MRTSGVTRILYYNFSDNGLVLYTNRYLLFTNFFTQISNLVVLENSKSNLCIFHSIRSLMCATDSNLRELNSWSEFVIWCQRLPIRFFLIRMVFVLTEFRMVWMLDAIWPWPIRLNLRFSYLFLWYREPIYEHFLKEFDECFQFASRIWWIFEKKEFQLLILQIY